jgi:hypothetical protein
MTEGARAGILDSARLDMFIDQSTPAGEGRHIERRLVDLLGAVTIPVARWFDLWSHLRWLLPGWDRLGLQMQRQQETNWCWAATATSIAVYYDPSTTWTQCAVANAQLNRTDCCGGAGATYCNVYGYLDAALQTVGHFDHIAAGAASVTSVDGEIDAGRPLGIRVEWRGGGAHFLAAVGYLEDAVTYVAVDDPIYGKSDVTYDALNGAYQGLGIWTHSYYTKS